jgi:hypothetical protein
MPATQSSCLKILDLTALKQLGEDQQPGSTAVILLTHTACVSNFTILRGYTHLLTSGR